MKKYSFTKELDQIVKQKWHALEVEKPTPVNSNEIAKYDELEIDHMYKSPISMIMRVGTEYLLEYVQEIRGHFNGAPVDITFFTTVLRFVLEHFEPFGRMMTFMELKYGDEAFILDDEQSSLPKEENLKRSDLIKEVAIQYMKMMSKENHWAMLPQFNGGNMYEIFVLMITVIVKMIEMEPMVHSMAADVEMLQDEFKEDDQDIDE